MEKRNLGSDSSVDQKKSGDRGDMRRTGEDTAKDMRKVNENIRKSQGDDAGEPPAIDRHR